MALLLLVSSIFASDLKKISLLDYVNIVSSSLNINIFISNDVSNKNISFFIPTDVKKDNLILTLRSALNQNNLLLKKINDLYIISPYSQKDYYSYKFKFIQIEDVKFL